MKRSILSYLLFFSLMVPSQHIIAGDYLIEADLLYNHGGLTNYQQAIDLYQKALEAKPDDYEANWKCARAYREYGEEAKIQDIKDWQDICADYGKRGIKYAQKATQLEPNKPDGHYYYGLCVGVYADGVSVLTALKEGLKNKTQKSLEKAYALDKFYDNAGPILALGRFWAVLPWPFQNKKKALNYYREYQATKYFIDTDKGPIYLADLLLKMKGKENKDEAKTLLLKILKSEKKYYRDWAKRLLEK